MGFACMLLAWKRLASLFPFLGPEVESRVDTYTSHFEGGIDQTHLVDTSHT
jgi:hypothetical protein